MVVPGGEADDLVLDRRTIPWADALDLAGIHRRAVKVCVDDCVGRRRRPRDAAFDLGVRDPVRQERERDRRIVSGLHFERGPVDGGAIEPGWRPGFQATQLKAKAFQGQR